MTATSHYRITESNLDHLTISAPGNSIFSSWISVILIAVFLLMTYTTSRTVRRIYQTEKTPIELRAYVWRYRITLMAITLSGLGALWLFGYNSGSIEFDR